MIRKLNEGDRDQLNRLLASAPETNLYTQGNLDVLGFERDFCEFFGDFGEDGLLRGCANRYMVGWGVYGLANADFAGLAGLIAADPNALRLQDNPGGIETIVPLLRNLRAEKQEEEQFMRLEEHDFNPQPIPPGSGVRRATIADLPELIAFFADAGDMSRSPAGTERPLRDGTVFVAEIPVENKKTIVASALTNAQSATMAMMAMVGGVYTLPAYRGRGLSQAVVGALCAYLLGQGVTPLLYWKTPAAGHVYRKLGFHPIGVWRSVWLGLAQAAAG